MKRKQTTDSMKAEIAMKYLMPLLICLAATSCRQQSNHNANHAPATPAASLADPLTLALAPHSGTGRLDREIIQLQDKVRASKQPDLALERLGWKFVAKARESFDPGLYKLAEQCALALEARHSHSPEALLLRGHALHNLHRFKEAEPLARQLTGQRGLPFDFGLLGDVLMEQGNLGEAVEAYQKMVDLRPDLHSYARGAHIRWLKGNLKGAEKLIRLAADAASSHDGESAAWVHVRLGAYQFQSGAFAEAERTCAAALDFQKDYPPALLLQGRLLLAQAQYGLAAQTLRRAMELNTLPEYQWALAEALRADGHAEEAAAVEAQLRRHGPATDPRTYSLYLATRGESAAAALRLAEEELKSRGDVFTHDALAWALAAAGRLDQAQRHAAQALSEGTQDGRLFFHAAVIAHRGGYDAEAARLAAKATQLRHLLLPSEREQLLALAARLETASQDANDRSASFTPLQPAIANIVK
jgi:tetratricopeptide (TPR) repeat protein